MHRMKNIPTVLICAILLLLNACVEQSAPPVSTEQAPKITSENHDRNTQLHIESVELLSNAPEQETPWVWQSDVIDIKVAVNIFQAFEYGLTLDILAIKKGQMHSLANSSIQLDRFHTEIYDSGQHIVSIPSVYIPRDLTPGEYDILVQQAPANPINTHNVQRPLIKTPLTVKPQAYFDVILHDVVIEQSHALSLNQSTSGLPTDEHLTLPLMQFDIDLVSTAPLPLDTELTVHWHTQGTMIPLNVHAQWIVQDNNSDEFCGSEFEVQTPQISTLASSKQKTSFSFEMLPTTKFVHILKVSLFANRDTYKQLLYTGQIKGSGNVFQKLTIEVSNALDGDHLNNKKDIFAPIKIHNI